MLDGVQLTLLLGPRLLVPAPAPIVEALSSIEVVHNDDDRSGFTATFQLDPARGGAVRTLGRTLLAANGRLRLLLSLAGRPRALLDGVITQQQLSRASDAGGSTLTVTGEDLGALMDRKPRQHAHAAPDLASVVARTLADYAPEGVQAKVVPLAAVGAGAAEAIFSQSSTDYAFLRDLAGRYGYSFHLSPHEAGSLAYWGPPLRGPATQRAISVDFGAATNVQSIQFRYDSLGPERVTGYVLDPDTHALVPVSSDGDLGAPLSREGAARGPATVTRGARILGPSRSVADAMARARGRARSRRDALVAEGELDLARYGELLQVRSLVGVRGAGDEHDGLYLVKQVRHQIRRGGYTMHFTLQREGFGTTVPGVRT